MFGRKGAWAVERAALVLIVALYGLLAVLYAANVPQWNAPDEPAHFNYVRQLAEQGQFPVLAAGDYDFAYLERLKAARFPPQMSIDAIRYEGHQPPLYYLLAAPLFRATAGFGLDGQVLALRLFSSLLGLLMLLVSHAAVQRLLPAPRWLAPAVVAFVAFTPMHLAVNAAIGNDPLANLMLTVVAWAALGIVLTGEGKTRGVLARRTGRLAAAVTFAASSPYGRLGVWVGLALLTKTTAYAAVVVAAAAVLMAARAQGNWRRGARRLAGVGAIALLISGWWFLRNAAVYGPGDPLGLQRHNTVMVAAGQPLTGAIDGEVLRLFAAITFQSFWGQFGWMGVPMDERVYAVLAAVTFAAALGLALGLLRLRWRPLRPAQRGALQLLALNFLLVVGAMAYYGLSSFFQPQGRYLFPALATIALGFVAGLRELAAPRHAPWAIGAVLAALVVLDFVALYAYIVPALRPAAGG